MSVFANKLKKARKEKGITQRAMAEYLSMREQAYQMYEYGKREPDFETLQKIAYHLETTPNYLLGQGIYRHEEFILTHREYFEELILSVISTPNLTDKIKDYTNMKFLSIVDLILANFDVKVKNDSEFEITPYYRFV